MPFNNRSRLDTSQVEDRRGRGRGTMVAAGGGGLGVVILAVSYTHLDVYKRQLQARRP